jgi:hypothetical protein
MRHIVALCGQLVFSEMIEDDEGKIAGKVYVVNPEKSFIVDTIEFGEDSLKEAVQQIKEKLPSDVRHCIKFYEILSPLQPVEIDVQ